MDSQQLHRNDQNRGDLPQADVNYRDGTDVVEDPVNPPSEPARDTATPAATSDPHVPAHSPSAPSISRDVNYGDGTTVIGDPVNPQSNPEPDHATATSAAINYPHVPGTPQNAGSHAPSNPPTYESLPPSNVPSAPPSFAGNFPTAQNPQSFSKPANQSAVSQSPASQATSASPYVQTSSVPGATGKTPMDNIMEVFNKWGKKAEDMTGNVWNHLKTGPNVADTAFGRIAMGTKAMTGGGLENVYRQTFEVDPEEHLLKTFACYLSTSTGPVAGTLYISSHKLAFCSDRPLAIPAPPSADNNNTTNASVNNTTNPANNAANSPVATATSASKNSRHSSSAQQKQQQQQQQQWCYYKVAMPISQVESVNPSENTEKKTPEKYVQVKTTDGHEFWFMGFVNYDKGVKNLQESLLSKTTGPNTSTESHVVNN